MTSVVANTFFKDHEHDKDIIAVLSDVQRSASTVVRRVVSDVHKQNYLTKQPNHDLSTCIWCSVQSDESIDNSSAMQQMVFIRMVFSDSPEVKNF